MSKNIKVNAVISSSGSAFADGIRVFVSDCFLTVSDFFQ